MITVLVFHLPEENSEFQCVNNAARMASTLSDIRRIIRGVQKYESQSSGHALEEIRRSVEDALTWEEA